MKKQVSFLLLSLLFTMSIPASSCQDYLLPFLSTVKKIDTKTKEKTSLYSLNEQDLILAKVHELNLNEETQKNIFNSLATHQQKVDTKTINLYLEYSNTFRGEKLKSSIADIAFLGQKNHQSSFINEFSSLSEKLPKKYFLYKNQMSLDEFSSLYFSCKSAVPNPNNENAKRIFSKFSTSLSSLTVGASYAYYNDDKEKDFHWYAQLGYEVGFSAFTSFMSSKVQTNPGDPQHIKSIKNYFLNRIYGLSDLTLYPILFSSDDDKVQKRVNDLRGNPQFDEEIKKLHLFYEERGLYPQFKNVIIDTYRKIIQQEDKIEIAGIDWSHLTEADLDRPEIQEVLILAATAELYELNRGTLLDTGDVGLDRYLFYSLSSAILIPRNMVQSYLTYQILCMGQKNPKSAIIKAAIFSTTLNFFVSQGSYSLRKKTINQ